MAQKDKKVLILIQYLSPGGIEWMVAHLAAKLQQKSSWKPVVFVYDQNGVEPIDSFLTEKNISLFRVQKPAGFPFKMIMKLFQLVRREKIKVIHVHHLGALMMATFIKLMSLNQIKIVYTQHSFIHLAKYPRYQLFEKIFCFFADDITAVSEQVQQEFRKYQISNKKISLIPNGSAFPELAMIELDELQKKRLDLLKSENVGVNISIKDFWILYLGRIHQGKGQHHALKVWDELPIELKNQTQLLFIGPVTDIDYGKQLSDLIQMSSKPERIHILHPTLHAHQWMQASNVFMSASESEGWPMAVLEALGAGVPCLLSNISGHQMYQGWALFYDVNDPRTGALEVQSLLQKQTANLFTAYRQNEWVRTQSLRNQYTIDKMVHSFENIYDSK